MTDADKRAFRSLMLDMARPHPQFEDMRKPKLNNPLMRIYYRALEDDSLEDVTRAVHALERTSKWLPKPAELRDEITRYRLAHRDTGESGEAYVPSPFEVGRQRRREQADPAVKTAAALQQAWTDRGEAVANGLSIKDADRGFATVLRELLPQKANDPPCAKCIDGLVGFTQGPYRLDAPCVCPAGDKWKQQAMEATRDRRWTALKALEGAA